MKILYIFIGLVLLFSACSTKTPVVVKYKISSNLELDPTNVTKCKEQSIKVSSTFTSSNLMSKDMSYTQGGSKVYEYSESAWLNNPNRSVTRELIKMLRDSDIYKSVQESKSRSKSDLVVESTLEEFMQYYSDDLKQSYVIVRINFSIIDTQTSEVIAEETFKSRVESKSLDADGGVKALNIALKEVLSDSSQWFVKGCR